MFPNVPLAAGLPCTGEDKSIYRRGARRWRKLYRVNGHIFQANRFNRVRFKGVDDLDFMDSNLESLFVFVQKAFCVFCRDRIWGLGRQGFKCINCKLMVHKKCHKLYRDSCTGTFDASGATSAVHSSESSPQAGHVHHDHHRSGGHDMNGSDITILSKDDIKLSNARAGTPGTHRRPHQIHSQ